MKKLKQSIIFFSTRINLYDEVVVGRFVQVFQVLAVVQPAVNRDTLPE